MSVAELRETDRVNASTLIAGVAAAIVLAHLSWVGFVVGGAIAGLGQRSPKRGVLAGFVVGVASLVAFAVVLSTDGNLGDALAMGQITYVAVAVPLVFSTLGGLVRGVV